MSDVRKIKPLSAALRETYKDYFYRGTAKFISRFGFKRDDLGKTYTLPEGDFILTGQINERTLLMEKEGNEYYVDGTYFNQSQKKE